MFAALLRDFGSHRFEVRIEVPLSVEPLRADYLFLRRTAGPDDTPGTLHKLWDLLPEDTIVELKSIGHPYRARNLDRFLSYLHLHYADQTDRLRQRSDLSGVLIVVARTPSLEADVLGLRLSWDDLGDGYWRLRNGAFQMIVAEIDMVAEAEDDDLLRLFGHRDACTVEARRWFSQKAGSKESAMAMHELEGYDEVIRKILANLPPEQVLAAYAPEERVAGLAPEQRVAGLSAEQRLLLLPDEMLRALPDSLLETLSAATRAAILARTGR